MRNNDWKLRACIVGGTLLLGLGPLFAEVSGDSKSAAPPASKPHDEQPAPANDSSSAPQTNETEIAPELEDRLVILPEIKREGERFFLSSFQLPDKLTFAGQSIPLDNWQVRERIEYDLLERRTYDFLLSRAAVEDVPADTEVLSDKEW